MDKLDEKYEAIANNKIYNDDLLARVKEVINTAIKKSDYTLMYEIPDMYDEKRFVLTAEIARVNNIILIAANESRFRKRDCFLDDVSDYDSLYSKYIQSVLMLRRIEMYSGEEFAEPAYDYVSNQKLSPESIIAILDKEYFEKKNEVIKNIFFRQEGNLSDSEKLEWLSNISEEYHDEWAYIKLAVLYVKYGQKENAINILEKIDNPSDEIKKQIKTLKEMA